MEFGFLGRVHEGGNGLGDPYLYSIRADRHKG